MKYFWTRYLIIYPKTVIYMLQSTEYNLSEYLKWLGRSKDFRSIMKKRSLKFTSKAKLLFAVAWLIFLTCLFISILLFVRYIFDLELPFLLLAVFAWLITPYLVSLGIILPLWIGQKFVQKPKERRIIESARQLISNHPALKIAIAGSYGKTTMKEILRTVLAEGKKVAFTPGNMNTPIGISRFAKKLDGNEDIIIFELGEGKPGDIKELCELTKPDMGIITGINEAHLLSFGTLDKTIATIYEMQDYLGDKPIYKNIDCVLVSGKTKSDDKLAFSQKGVNDWKISRVEVSVGGTSFQAVKQDNKMLLHTDLLGRHNLGFMSVAIDIASSVGLSSKQIKSGISETKPFEHRMQPREFHGAWMIDDTYNGNSDGVRVGLELLKELPAKRRIYITPGLVEQGNKTEEVHITIGEQIAQVADVVYLMRNSVTDYIQKGLQKGNFGGELVIIDDPNKFYANLDQYIAVGDVFLMQNDWTDNYA